MLLIIIGIILDAFGIIGILAVIGGQASDPVTSLIIYLVFLLIGIGLILWGAKRRNNKKIQDLNDKEVDQNKHTSMNKDIQETSLSDIFEPNTPTPGETSLITFEWKRKWILFDFPIMIYVDDTLVGVDFIKIDSKFTIPISKGLHILSVKMGVTTQKHEIQIEGNQVYLINIEYRRSIGKLDLRSSVSGTAQIEDIANAINILGGRMAILNEITKMIKSGYKVRSLSLTDTTAKMKLSKYNYNMYMILLFILGILPAVIYILITEFTSKKVSLEITSEGLKRSGESSSASVK